MMITVRMVVEECDDRCSLVVLTEASIVDIAWEACQSMAGVFDLLATPTFGASLTPSNASGFCGASHVG